MIVFNNFNNFMGSIIFKFVFEDIIFFVKERDIIVFVDEVYNFFYYFLFDG